MTAFRLALAPLLLLVAADAARAAPEDELLAGLSGEFREPRLRCEWIAGQFDSVEQRLSLYREELAAIHVQADGARVGDSATGTVQLVAFESRLAGPASATIVLDTRRIGAPERLRVGRRIEVSFTDRAGKHHPLFCGPAALVRADAANGRTTVVALIPRAGNELQGSAQYENLGCPDVLASVAESVGLQFEAALQRPQNVYASMLRRDLATWPFMRQVARQCRMELVLQGDGRIAVTDSTFADPQQPAVSRTWSNMSWVDVATQIAANLGRSADAQVTSAQTQASFHQHKSDEEFLLDLAIAARASTWYTPGKLLLREDGVWSKGPPKPALPRGYTDRLLKRVIVTGSTAIQRSFTRLVADPRALSVDPERAALVETILLMGRAMPAAALPPLPLANGAAIAAALEAALARLDAGTAATPERLFLRDLVRVYRPTVQHFHRLQPDGQQTLDAIGR